MSTIYSNVHLFHQPFSNSDSYFNVLGTAAIGISSNGFLGYISSLKPNILIVISSTIRRVIKSSFHEDLLNPYFGLPNSLRKIGGTLEALKNFSSNV